MFVYLPCLCTGADMFMPICSKIDRAEFGVWESRIQVPGLFLSSHSPLEVARVRGTSVVIIRLIEVDAEDSYCHQGVNKRKEPADLC